MNLLSDMNQWVMCIIKVSPLVEENKHWSIAQRLGREDWQQLDTWAGYLCNVGRIHHELRKKKTMKKKKCSQIAVIFSIFICQIMKMNAMHVRIPYNDRGAVLEVTGPYRAHAASQLSHSHLLPFQRQVNQICSYLAKRCEVLSVQHQNWACTFHMKCPLTTYCGQSWKWCPQFT